MKEQSQFYLDHNKDKVWYLPSKGRDYYHRLDGPAYVCYDEQGKLEDRFWYVNDVIIDDMDDWLKENNITEPFSNEDRMAIKLYIS